ncbi:MAG: hypothetical protein JWN81_2228 [Solirubrobacterales bacterium]|nr:hypothetical protein [Solirubrobacterales bacterium]
MDAADEAEVVDALPVLAIEPTVMRAKPLPGALARSGGAVIPAVQAAAVAAGGFVAGAAVVGLVQRRQRRSASILKGGRRGRGGGRVGRTAAAGGELVQIVSSRSLLVDLHLLGPAGQER